MACALVLGACGGSASPPVPVPSRVETHGEVDAAADVAEPPVDATADVLVDAEFDARLDAVVDTFAAPDVDVEPDTAIELDAALDAAEVAFAPLGSFTNPVVIPALPYSDTATTVGAPSDAADAYSCAPATGESGPERVYVVTVASGLLTLAVDDVSGDAVDVDVHLLSAPDPASCLARDNIKLTKSVAAGTYWIVADTWVSAAGVEMPGPYTLTVTWSAGGDPTDCTTSPITCTEADMPLVNGVPEEAPGDGGCPAGMVPVEGFCIDRYEAMLAKVQPDGTLAPWSPYANPGDTPVRALSVAGVVPQGYISQVRAKAACDKAGKRLCTDAEWKRACQGPSTWTYPYGPTLKPKVCNDSRTCHPAVQYFETTASWIWSELGNPCLNQLPDGLAESGAYDGCVTAEGVFDMMGNLHEWTADPNGTFRGGFYVDTKVNGPGCLYATTAHDVSHWDYSTGFRCCADP